MMGGIFNPVTPRKRFLFDDFNLDVAGPLATPRTCNPGPGTVTFIATPPAAEFSISGGKLQMAKPTSGPSYDTYRMTSQAYPTILCGLACYVTVLATTVNGVRLAMLNEAYTAFAGGVRLDSTTVLYGLLGGVAMTLDVSVTNSVEYRILGVSAPPYAIWFIKGGSQYPSWKLLFVDKGFTPITVTAVAANFNSTGAYFDKFGAELLPWNWQQPHRIMQTMVPLPVAGTVYSTVANGFICIEWRPSAAEILIIRFRRTDDDNCYRLECDQTNSTIKLFRRQAGVDTELNTGKTQTWLVTNQFRIAIRTDGTRIQTFTYLSTGSAITPVQKHTATGETFNQTETGLTISGFVTTANLEVWPRDFLGTDVQNIQPPNSVSDQPDENLCVWTTDWHVTDTISTRTKREKARDFAYHINSLRPKVVLNLGDNGEVHARKEDYEYYRDYAHSIINRPMLVLRGNHDEDVDWNTPGENLFTVFDSVFPNLPYHGTLDWEAPKIRFIGYHAYVVHSPDAELASFRVAASERTWLSDQIAAIPIGWKSIICSHPPLLSSMGNNIVASSGQTEVLAMLAAAGTAKIAAYFCGHRHQDNINAVQDGIIHITGICVGYSGAGGAGFNLIRFDPGANTLTLEMVSRGHFNTPFNNSAGATIPYVPIVISLS